MKKISFSVTLLFLAVLTHAQTNPIDEMFDKYSDREGFTVVTISSKMFSMFSGLNTENKEADNVIAKLKSIRILSVEDSLLNKNINFYTEFKKKLDLSVYEELMMFKEGPDITRFMIKQNGNIISELLVITGGPNGNSLISIKGDMNLKNISELSKSTGIKGLKNLDKIDKKPDLSNNEQKEAKIVERQRDWEALGTLLKSRKFAFVTDRVQGTIGATIYNVIQVDEARVFVRCDNPKNTSGRYSGEADNTTPLLGPTGLFFDGDISNWELSKNPKDLSYSIKFNVNTTGSNTGIFYEFYLNINLNKTAGVEIKSQNGNYVYTNYLGKIKTL